MKSVNAGPPLPPPPTSFNSRSKFKLSRQRSDSPSELKKARCLKLEVNDGRELCVRVLGFLITDEDGRLLFLFSALLRYRVFPELMSVKGNRHFLPPAGVD